MADVKIVMLGTGTPNALAHKSGPALTLVVNDQAYLFDCGPGLVRRASLAADLYDLPALKAENLNTCFISHLHSDHTAGLSDLLLTPWVLGRSQALKLFGSKGIKSMAHHLLMAYNIDIVNRRFGAEFADPEGYKIEAEEIKPGLFYQDENIKVFAYSVDHPPFEAYAFRVETPNGLVVYSGDTAPCPGIVDAAHEADLLIHEVYSHQGVQKRTPKWYKYHTSVHTSEVELAALVKKAKPKFLVLTHQLWMLGENEGAETGAVERRSNEIVEYLSAQFQGQVVSAKDLDLFVLHQKGRVSYSSLPQPLKS